MKNQPGQAAQSIVTPAYSQDGTFRSLMIERDGALTALQAVDRELLRKCLDEGWEDCVRLNYSKIRRRAR